MKKIFIVLAAGVIALSFAGCGNGQATTQEAVDTLADSWEDVDSLEVAEELAGFEVELPLEVASEYDELTYRYCSALNEIEVEYSEGNLRKAKDNGDISGDYEEYKEVLEVTENGLTATLKGSGDGVFNLAIWRNGDFAYSISQPYGATAAEMKSLIGGFK